MRFSMITYLLILSCLFLPNPSFANDYERYKAVAFGNGGIFIIDTKEGHTWTWSNRGDYTVDGHTLSLEYQGNVRSNMKFKKQKKITLDNDSHIPASDVANEDGELRY